MEENIDISEVEEISKFTKASEPEVDLRFEPFTQSQRAGISKENFELIRLHKKLVDQLRMTPPTGFEIPSWVKFPYTFDVHPGSPWLTFKPSTIGLPQKLYKVISMPPHIKEFEKGKKFFEENLNKLLKDYEDEFIAIIRGRVVDHSKSKKELVKRVFEKHGYTPMYIQLVSKEKRVVELPSPEI
jgi:hypothetical protein